MAGPWKTASSGSSAETFVGGVYVLMGFCSFLYSFSATWPEHMSWPVQPDCNRNTSPLPWSQQPALSFHGSLQTNFSLKGTLLELLLLQKLASPCFIHQVLYYIFLGQYRLMKHNVCLHKN